MWNSKKYKKLSTFIVILVGLGLIMAYVPLIFVTPDAINQQNYYPTEPQPSPQEPVTPTSTETSPTESPIE